MTEKSFNLIVLGTGSGGSTDMGKCVKAGWKDAQFLKLLKERSKTLFNVGFVANEGSVF